MKAYILTAKSHPWLLSSLEETLQNTEIGAANDISRLVRSVRVPGGRPISDDEALIAANALCDLRVLERIGQLYSFNRERFEATEQLRQGIRAAVAVLDEGSNDDVASDVQLCVSLPPSLSSEAEHVIHESSTDLRSSLMDVVASAKQTLIVASPFWDAGTTAEMVALSRKKLDSGVQVWLLGRFSQELPAEVKSQLRKVADEPNCKILSWFEGAGKETQTFHFKAISTDRGRRGYLGSANMTVSSLRSRMELGVILTGVAAAQLDRILRVVITMAAPISV
jgi:hypothetical protein